MPISFDSSHWDNCWTNKKGLRREIRGAILAAGLGKRMQPLSSHHLPKPLFPLGGKVPLAELWVRKFVESGITDITMNLCVLSQTIKRHFVDGARFAANMTYLEESVPSGTLGGVCKQALGSEAKQTVPDKDRSGVADFSGSTLLVPSGDIVTNFSAEMLKEMYEIHKSVGAALTMVLVPVPWDKRKDFGTVILDKPKIRNGGVSRTGRIAAFKEKDPDSPSNLNNASIYMIERDFLEMLDPLRSAADPSLDEGFYDFGKHVFPAALGGLPYCKLPKDCPLWGLEFDGRWYDVGQKRDYLRVNEAVLDGNVNIWLPYEQFAWGFMGTNVTIDFAKTQIIPPVVIGNNCVIEPGTTIGPYAVIGDDWIIEKGATVRHSVLWERYSFLDKDGKEQSVAERQLVDRHEIRRGVTVEESIVAGGAIDQETRERTVLVLADGELENLPIDYVPDGPRA